jgi:dTDP-glucose 4,6-dehydratase
MNQNILVLGSNSPSGASFCKVASSQGHKIIATSRSEEPLNVFLPYKWQNNDVEFHQVDLNNDLERLESLAKKYKTSYIVNFASQSMVGQSWLHPEHWMQTNVVSQVKLLELMRKFDFLERYVHFSTPEVYGSTDGWIEENYNYSPSTPYASSRAAGDMNVKLWADTYDMPNIITRAANIYGAGQQLYRIIPKTFLSCQLGEKLSLHGGGYSERAFIHIDDASAAVLRILTNGKNKETYHISPHEKIRIKDLVSKICMLSNIAFSEVVEITEDRIGKDQAYLLDSNKIMNELNWQPKISLEQGLDDVGRWCEKNLDILKHLPSQYTHKL